MCIRTRDALLSAVLAAAACAQGGAPATPGASQKASVAAAALPDVRFSEIHYDNVGTDAGEAIEIEGPAGTDLTGWSIVLYNGSGGASYNTATLSGTLPDSCAGRGVVVQTYPSNGIQNGSPDGMALVDATGAVVEFLSYEGTFAATGGPANGQTSVDIGVFETGVAPEPLGDSLARDSSGVWSGPAPSSFGACNGPGGTPVPDAGPPPPMVDAGSAPVVASVTLTPLTSTILVGGAQTFTAQALDAGGATVSGVTFSWTSSNGTVATVNASGIATGVALGDAVITASAGTASASTTMHVVVAPPPPFPDVRLSELHYDNTGTDAGEAIEVSGPAGTVLDGWAIVLYDGTTGKVYNTTPLAGTIPDTCDPRGVVVQTYPSNGIQNGSPDGMALVDAAGHVQEFLSYEGLITAADGPAAGMISSDIIASESSAPVGVSLQRDSFNHWALVNPSTFGACNVDGAPPVGNSISFSGRSLSDPPLPVGFQAQLFATERDVGNAVVTTTFTWSSDSPTIASIDANGVFTSLAAGTAVLRATAVDGTTATTSLPTIVGVASTTAEYVGNTEFGEPTDSDPSDDFIVVHPEYTASYNPNRGGPNWVAFDLDPTDYGPEDRCNCFTMDPALPSTFTQLTTNDYTGSGAIAGFGIDRGHMTRSFDRTSASLDNAFTYYFSNVVPQTSEVNQGPWALLENDLGDMVRTGGKEVYVIDGATGNIGTLKNEGKIVIPASTWKVAVVMPHNKGLADIVDYRDIQVIAVNMPNVTGVRNDPWQKYKTTVDAIEELTGYDLLALLPDKIEDIVEAGIQPPIAGVDGPWTSVEGNAVAMSAAASVDPNGTVVDYAWDFGDGQTGTGATVTHTYGRFGTYSVRLIVTDNDGLTDTLFSTANVTDVAPTVSGLVAATLLKGAGYTAAGTFTDPGAGPFTATVSWGDGSAATTGSVTGGAFSFSHTYAAAGSFTATVQISDGLLSGSASATVTVQSPSQVVQSAIGLVDGLVAAGKLDRVSGAVLKVELALAKAAFDRGDIAGGKLILKAVVAEIDALVTLRRLSAADAAPLRGLLTGLIATLGG